MYDRTPLRQLRQIYSSILALARLPTIAEDINKTIAAGAAQHTAAIERLISQLFTQPAPVISAPVIPAQPDNTPQKLSTFRSELLHSIEERMLCVDVGARWGADGALMVLKDKAKLLCFDPDQEECARLQAGHSIEDVEYVPIALSSDGRELSLTVTTEPAGSSIYPPVEVLYKSYPALEMITPEKVVAVPSTSLDKYLADRQMPKPAVYKLDTQGSELDILKGVAGNLSDACMIDIEVQFNPLYHGAALFGDVDVFLRSQGFSLWRLPLLVHYTEQNVPSAEAVVQSVSTPPSIVQTSNPGNGQIFWGQAHYVRTDCLNTNDTPITSQIALRSAAIVSAYGYWDLALMILTKCTDTKSRAAALRAILGH